jgi:hypothetical protein
MQARVTWCPSQQDGITAKRLLPLDVAFIQRDRRLAAVQYKAHAFTAVGYAHNDAGVNFHPGAAGSA